MIEITVIYAAANKQVEVPLTVAPNYTVIQAIECSKILKQFPEIVVGITPVGINSKKTTWDAPLQAGDRVEIYRPLLIDPKDARRKKLG